MKKTDVNFYRDRKVFLFMTIVAIGCYIFLWVLDWNFDQTSASLFTLTRENVSEIKIFNSKTKQVSPLATLTSPKDDKLIERFIRVTDNISPINPPSRELILSHGLYIVINLKDRNKPIELLLHLHKSCEKAVYIDIVKKIGGEESESIFYGSGAKSEFELYEWLQSINLLTYLGCN